MIIIVVIIIVAIEKIISQKSSLFIVTLKGFMLQQLAIGIAYLFIAISDNKCDKYI